MKVKARRKTPTISKLVARLHQHLQDTDLLTSYAVPPFEPEEVAKARALASQIHGELRKDKTQAEGRVASLAVIEAYRMQVYGIIRYIEEQTWKQKQPQSHGSAQPAKSPDDQTATETPASLSSVEPAPTASEPLTSTPPAEAASEQ